jgi:hypothetical protein
MLDVSEGGYDIQRRVAIQQKQFETCVTLTAEQLADLRATSEFGTTLGDFLYGAASGFTLISSAAMADYFEDGPQGATAVAVDTAIRSQVRASSATALAAVSRPGLERIILELLEPTTAVRFTSVAETVSAYALRDGKVVQVAESTSAGDPTGTLESIDIDTVVLYTLGLEQLGVCVALPNPEDAESWSKVPYLVRGLTLPVVQVDPTLTSPAAELAAAHSRLFATETLSSTQFDALTASLRIGASHPELGRDGERILLMRDTTDDPFSDISFGGQLTILQVHPQWRRVLGFGWADLEKTGLTVGQDYEYRITGRFNTAALNDRIYDVHDVPSNAVLPTRFFIGDVAFRFAQPPTIVTTPAPPATAERAATRRGLDIVDPNPLLGWRFTLTDWSLVIDFPAPVTAITFEIAPGHSLHYWAGDPWISGPSPTTAVPPGPLAKLVFSQPITQIRCTGTGTFFAVRIPTNTVSNAQGITTIYAETGPIQFSLQPTPPPPVALVAVNLQRPPTVLAGNIDQNTSLPTRPEPGFYLLWLPAAHGSVTAWPQDLPGGPPLDAMAYQVEHRDVINGGTHFGPWTPIQAGDNIVVGSRTTAPSMPLTSGADLDVVFGSPPPAPGELGLILHLQDIFTVPDPVTGKTRPQPALGSYHQYRIRAVDTVGRISDTWTDSNIARLEKHVPPPLPVGPQPAPEATTTADGTIILRGSPGPAARVLAGDSLSAADAALLGAHQNAIVLQWGWRPSERDLDPTTKEFRVYQWRLPPDLVPGTITAVSSIVGGWSLAFTTNRVLVANECVGQWITTGEYPFQITSHTAGSNVTLQVRAAGVNPVATPAAGSAQFGRPVSADHRRPPAWDARVAVVPVTDSDTYQYVFYDLLTLSTTQPTNSIWVGVSAADGESYIADELPTAATNGGRPGNESSIAVCTASGRYRGRPSFVVPPPLGDIPEIVTEEPTGREVLAFFDPSTIIPGVLPAGSPIAMDRCASDDILHAFSVSNEHVILTLPDGTTTTMDFPNPSDEAAAVATLSSDHPENLASQYLLYLAAHHPQPDTLFVRIGRQLDSFGPYSDRLPPKAGRYFYRVRQADAQGRVSPTGAILPVVIRVPSIAPPSAPDQISYTSSAAGVAITLRANNDPTITHLLVFRTITPVTESVADPGTPELVRIPNRQDLYPNDGIRLRTGDGSFVTPIVKPLTDADVTVDGSGNRTATIAIAASPMDWVTVWSYALSRDGIPSPVRGPTGRYVPRGGS